MWGHDLMKDKYYRVCNCRPNNKYEETAKRALAFVSYVSCHQTALKRSRLPACICFYCLSECAYFHWMEWRGKATCTHTLNTRSQPPAYFLHCGHLDDRPSLRAQRLHPQAPHPVPPFFHPQQRLKHKPSCPSAKFWPVYIPTRVTDIQEIRYKHSCKFNCQEKKT